MADPSEEILDEESFGEVLNFDPFEKTNGESSDDTVTEESEEQPSDAAPALPAEPEPAPEPQPQAAQLPEPPPLSTPAPSREQDLLETVQRQSAQIDQLIGMLQQRGQPEPSSQPEPQDPALNIPPYMFDVPDQLIDGLRSDDPAVVKMAYAHLISGAAQAIHSQMYGALQENLVPSIEARVRSVTEDQNRRQTMHDDFYNAYPQLNHPMLKPTVGQIAAQVASDPRYREWSSEMRDEIYRRVIEQLQTVQGFVTGPPSLVSGSNPAPAPPAPQVFGTPAPQPGVGVPPAIMDAGVRPTVSPRGSALSDEIEDLLS